MKYKLLIIIGFVLQFSAFSGHAQSRSLKALDAFYTQIRSLDTAFYQVQRDDKGKVIEKSKGRFTLTRPGRIRWEYTEPYKQLMISNSQTFWFYDVDLAQVTQRPAADALKGTPAILLSGGRGLRQQFNVTDEGKSKGLYWARLAPKTDQGDFAFVRIGFTPDNEPRVMELADRLGNFTEITFSRMQINPRISSRTYDFVPPQGVEVVTENMGMQTVPLQE